MVDLPAAVALAPNPKFWRSLLHRCYDVVDRVNGLLPRAMFVSVVLGLLGHAIPSIRRRAMELLSAKVQHQAQFFALPQDEATLLPLIPTLTAIAAGRSPSPQVGRVFPCFFLFVFFCFFPLTPYGTRRKAQWSSLNSESRIIRDTLWNLASQTPSLCSLRQLQRVHMCSGSRQGVRGM